MGLGNVLPANQMAQAMQMASHPTETMNKYLHDPSALMKGLESNPFARKMVCTRVQFLLNKNAISFLTSISLKDGSNGQPDENDGPSNGQLLGGK